jgi:hypothetical protein
MVYSTGSHGQAGPAQVNRPARRSEAPLYCETASVDAAGNRDHRGHAARLAVPGPGFGDQAGWLAVPGQLSVITPVSGQAPDEPP